MEAEIRLILHGDDAGMCHDANLGIKKAMEQGILRSASIMMPCPWARDMVRYAVDHRDWDFGIHLTLTSEWDSYRWGPVSNPRDVSSLLDEEGCFFKDERSVAAYAHPKEVEREIHAQIDLAERWGLHPKHLDNHMGSLFTRPEWVEIFYRIAVERGIPPLLADLTEEELHEINPALDVGSLDSLKGLRSVFPVLRSFSAVQHGSLEEKRSFFMQRVSSLKPGLHEIILHPACPNPELRAVTPSAEDRGRDLDLLLDDPTRSFLEERQVRVIHWGEAARAL